MPWSEAMTRAGADASAAARIGVPVETYRARREAGLRYCSGCQEWHPASAFGWRTYPGYQLWRLQESCPSGHRAASRERMRRMRERRRAG